MRSFVVALAILAAPNGAAAQADALAVPEPTVIRPIAVSAVRPREVIVAELAECEIIGGFVIARGGNQSKLVLLPRRADLQYELSLHPHGVGLAF